MRFIAAGEDSLYPPVLSTLRVMRVTSGGDDDRLYMQAATEEAKLSLNEGGIPIGGAVLVRDGGVILSRGGHNRRVQDDDPLMHAEINCIRNAGRIGRYGNTVLYSTSCPAISVREPLSSSASRRWLWGGSLPVLPVQRIFCGKKVSGW